MKQEQRLQVDRKNKELAKVYIENKANHYIRIVYETQNFWDGFNKDCFKAAENECLKSGYSLKK